MRNRVVTGLLAAIVVVGLVVANRRALLRFSIEQAVHVATGYTLSVGEQRIGLDRAQLLDVHVTHNGAPVLDARRVDATYSLMDLLPGSTHRFGLLGIAIEGPTFTLERHADGTYNLITPSAAVPSAQPAPPNPVPLRFTARLRDGSAIVVDDNERAAGPLRIVGINGDLTFDSAALSRYAAAGRFESTRQPIEVAGTIDIVRGYAMHRLRAPAAPIRTLGNTLINSPAARILGGTARNVDARLYALNLQPDGSFDYHIGARLDLQRAQMQVSVLVPTLDDITAHVQVVDNAVFTKHVDAKIRGVPLQAAGGVFDFTEPSFRLGVSGAANLSQLRGLFAFSRSQPVQGPSRESALLEGPVAHPIVVANFTSPHAYYHAAPIDAINAQVAVVGNDVILSPLHATYAGVIAQIRGSLIAGDPAQSDLAVHVTTLAKHLPYLNELIPSEPIVADAILRGSGRLFRAHGQVVSQRDVGRAAAMFAFESDGVADVAPFYVHEDHGGTATGRYVLDRRTGANAFWFVGENLRLYAPSTNTFPGITLTALPPIDGALAYAAVVGGGSSGHDVVIAGRLNGANASIANIAFNAIGASFAGNLRNASINALHAEGPWGRFDGAGSFSDTQLVASGRYAGTLQGLRPYIGQPAVGAASGPVALAVGAHGVVVQVRDIRLGPGAAIHGVPVERASGTIGYDNGLLRVYAAQAEIAGGSLVAAGDYGVSAQTHSGGDALELVGTGLHGQGLRGLGVPIDSGSVAVDGTLAAQPVSLPAFDGGVVIRDGRSQGYPVSGSALLGLHGAALRVDHGVAGLGSSYGYVAGDVAALTSHAPTYALRADVPAADIGETLRMLRFPNYQTEGVFGGTLTIGGSGSAPTVNGPMLVPGGEVNGLPFINARADVSAGAGSVAARRGSLRVGTTQLAFRAHVAPSFESFGVRSSHANLADFDYFFDTGDTLDGRGPIDVRFGSGNHRASTRGDVDLVGLRYRGFPFGTTTARWSSLGDDLTGQVAIGGSHGTLRASGSISLAPSKDFRRLLVRSRYDVDASAAQVDLNTWLPAAGYPTVPLLGRVNADARVRGAYPKLSITGNAALIGGSFAQMPIDRLTASVRAANASTLYLRQADFEAPGVTATGQGMFRFGADAPLSLTIHAASSDLPTLIRRLTKRTIAVAGSFESTAQVGGTFAHPTFSAGFEGNDVDAYGVKIDSLFGAVRLHHNGIELRNAGATLMHGQATLAGTMPLQLRPFSIGPGNQAVNFDLELTDVDPGVFDTLLGHDTKMGGSLAGHVGLSGTVRAPRIFGRLQLHGGSYVSDLERSRITGTVATLSFDRTAATLENLTANFGRGQAQARGMMSFPRGFGSYGAVQYAVHAMAKGAQLDLPTYGRGTLDASADLTRNGTGLGILRGKATLSNAVIPIAAFLAGSGTAAGGASPIVSPQAGSGTLDLAFDYDVAAGRGVRVRGGGFGGALDIGVSGEATLGGTLHAPTLDGGFASTGGTVTYVDRAFNMQTGAVTFDPADGIVPALNAVAITHVLNPGGIPYGSTDVTISLSGELTHLKVDFASNPPGYSREQILALIAPFGGLVNGVAFTTNAAAGPASVPGLPEAPLPNGGPLPTVAVTRSNGTVTVGQEAFNIINAQFATALLAPLETQLGQGLGLSNVALSVDFYGNVGVNVRRGLGRHLNAVYAYTFGLSQRQTFGLEYAPSDSTVAQLAFFFDNGPQRLFYGVNPVQTISAVTAGQAVFGQSGFALTVQRRFW